MGIAGACQAQPPDAAAGIQGQPPSYTNRTLTEAPNAAAMTRHIWVPGLDDGFIPQGMTAQAGSLFVAGYVAIEKDQNKGPCRLYRIDPKQGAVTGMLALPAACGHGGGAARGPKGRLFVVDTRTIFEVRLAQKPGPTIGTIGAVTRLKGKLLGSFAAGSGDAVWLGGYRREGEAETRLYRIPVSSLTGGDLDERAATASLPLPDRAQGAAFDGQGRLWISRSGSRLGELLRLNPGTGAIEAQFAMPAGIEDLAFDAEGGLWSVSEAGTRRWNSWPTFFPLIFRIDTTQLR